MAKYCRGSQLEFFKISANWRRPTCDLSCLTLVTCCYSGQRRQSTASMEWMANTHTYTHCGSSPILHVPRWEHNKSQIRSVQGCVFWREWTRWKALRQCLIWFLMEGNICNGNLSLGTKKGLSTVFSLHLTVRETEIDIKGRPSSCKFVAALSDLCDVLPNGY